MYIIVDGFVGFNDFYEISKDFLLEKKDFNKHCFHYL